MCAESHGRALTVKPTVPSTHCLLAAAREIEVPFRSDIHETMAQESPPYWALIAALFSSISLTESLAMSLYYAGCDLYERNQEAGEVAGDLLSGKLRRLKEHVVFGNFSGPAYEARIDTERGPGVVRFLITREGLQWMERRIRGRSPGASGAKSTSSGPTPLKTYFS